MPTKISSIIFDAQIDTGYLKIFCGLCLASVSSHTVGGSVLSIVLETNLSVSSEILMICIPWFLIGAFTVHFLKFVRLAMLPIIWKVVFLVKEIDIYVL